MIMLVNIVGMFLLFLMSIANGGGLPNSDPVGQKADFPTDIDASIAATSVGYYLQSLSKRELGVAQLQDIVNGLRDESKTHEDDTTSSLVSRLARKISRKIDEFHSNLEIVAESLSANIQMQQLRSHQGQGQDLPPPCCSSHLSNAVNVPCTVIHMGTNGTGTARFAATVFESHVAPRGTVRQFYMSSDGSSHVEHPIGVYQ
jgi:hypothetical protein